jgi:hypothetical protein
VARTAIQRGVEAGDVRARQAALAGSVQDADVPMAGGEVVGDRAGAVRGVVVDDEDRRLDRRGLPDGGDQRRQVLGLLVGRDDDPRGAHGNAALPSAPTMSRR